MKLLPLLLIPCVLTAQPSTHNPDSGVADSPLGANALISASTTDAVRQRFADWAKQMKFFETDFVVSNRAPYRTYPDAAGAPHIYANGAGVYATIWPESLAKAHAHMLEILQAAGSSHDALVALLKDKDPQMRTLALGALFLREDAHDLPLIIPLLDDKASTWPVYDMAEPDFKITPHAQTVGDVACAFVAIYLKASHMVGAYGNTAATLSKAYTSYWSAREKLTSTVGWTLVKMMRAGRQSLPLNVNMDVDRVNAEIKSMPFPQRAWTLLYVRYGVFHDNTDLLYNDYDLVAALRQVGPDALVNFLLDKTVPNQPDLNLKTGEGPLPEIADFILVHATDLLRPTDAQALINAQQLTWIRNASDSNAINNDFTNAITALLAEAQPPPTPRKPAAPTSSTTTPSPTRRGAPAR